MKNIAKCKLCQSIIESFHSTDYVECKCGQIAVDGGEAMLCYATNFANFLRVDDEGNEIIVKTIDTNADKSSKEMPQNLTKPYNREDLLKELDQMIQSIECLPKHVLHEPVSHCDLLAALMLISHILKY